MSRALLLFAIGCSLLACGDPNQGTAVGNPGDGMTVRIAPPAGLSVSRGDLESTLITLDGCAGGISSVVNNGRLELLDTPFIPLTVGEWCGVTIDVRGEFDVDIRGNENANLNLETEPVSMVTGLPFDTSAGLHILLLGGLNWPPPALLSSGDVTPGHPSHDTLVQRLVDDSFVFLDDGDGVFVGENDRVVAAANPARWGLPEPDVEDDEEDDD